MGIYRFIALMLLTFVLTIGILPVEAQSSTSIVPYWTRTGESSIFLQKGKQLYEEGKLNQAVEVLEMDVKEFEKKRELGNQARAYNYLSITYQDLGNWEAAKKAINQALILVEKVDDSFLYAQVLNTQGSLHFKTGNTETALNTWKEAEKVYRKLDDVTGITLSQINQAQALQTLGFYRRGKDKLEKVARDLEKLPDSLLKARGLRSLGINLKMLGNFSESQKVLSQSLTVAKKLESAADTAQALIELGNTAKIRDDLNVALNYYQQAVVSANDVPTQLSAQINQFRLLLKSKQFSEALELYTKIKKLLISLPPGRFSVYSRVNLVENLIENRELGIGKEIGNRELSEILAIAIKQAEELQDKRAQSYSVGQLGYLYERNKQFSDALNLTTKALNLAQGIQAEDIAANLLWQQGRIYKALGNQEAAIKAYSQAVNNLGALGQDLVQMSPDMQFSFRDEVEPVYRELVQLLLQNVDNLSPEVKQKRLEESRQVIEGLQVAQLENYLRAACLTYKTQPIEQIDKNAAVVYPIVLNNRLEVVLSLPNRPLLHYGTNISSQEENTVFNQLRQSLNLAFLPTEVLPPARKLYDWLLRPAQSELQNSNIETLVFVLDDFLRSVPMSVLHDGKQFIIEKYSIALTPGLQLFESRNLLPQQLKVLTGGLTQARQGFSALPAVDTEIAQISNFVKTEILLDEKFTRSKVQNKVESAPFSVIHLATHGQFSSKAEDTFLLTWENRINVVDLGKWLKNPSSNLRDREPVELLVLSACQTAKGDKGAALGLAGVAVRSGARSTLATLWSVQDKSTAEFIAKFYSILTQKRTTKAEALRQAQLSLLKNPKYQHPYYWSSFVLVGNWT
ncbi:MAG: CHAT domain-containing protein [Cyanobacteria bacterium P01_A01_bin.68]